MKPKIPVQQQNWVGMEDFFIKIVPGKGKGMISRYYAGLLISATRKNMELLPEKYCLFWVFYALDFPKFPENCLAS